MSKKTQSLDADIKHLHLEGWLKCWVTGLFRDGFKRRWLLREGEKLFIFASERELEHIDVIDLNNVIAVKPVDNAFGTTETEQFGFKLLTTDERKFFFLASSDDEQQQWVRGLVTWVNHLNRLYKRKNRELLTFFFSKEGAEHASSSSTTAVTAASKTSTNRAAPFKHHKRSLSDGGGASAIAAAAAATAVKPSSPAPEDKDKKPSASVGGNRAVTASGDCSHTKKASADNDGKLESSLSDRDVAELSLALENALSSRRRLSRATVTTVFAIFDRFIRRREQKRRFEEQKRDKSVESTQVSSSLSRKDLRSQVQRATEDVSSQVTAPVHIDEHGEASSGDTTAALKDCQEKLAQTQRELAALQSKVSDQERRRAFIAKTQQDKESQLRLKYQQIIAEKDNQIEELKRTQS